MRHKFHCSCTRLGVFSSVLYLEEFCAHIHRRHKLPSSSSSPIYTVSQPLEMVEKVSDTLSVCILGGCIQCLLSLIHSRRTCCIAAIFGLVCVDGISLVGIDNCIQHNKYGKPGTCKISGNQSFQSAAGVVYQYERSSAIVDGSWGRFKRTYKEWMGL